MVRRRSLPNCFASDINTDKQAVYDIVGKIFWTQFDCMTKNYRLKMVNSYDSLLHKEFEILTLQHILKIPRYRCTYYNVFRRLHLQHCLSLSQNYAARQRQSQTFQDSPIAHRLLNSPVNHWPGLKLWVNFVITLRTKLRTRLTSLSSPPLSLLASCFRHVIERRRQPRMLQFAQFSCLLRFTWYSYLAENIFSL